MVPWWGFLLLGVIAAAAAGFFPQMLLGHSPYAPVSKAFPPVAYLLLAACLAAALASGLRSLRLAWLFNDLRGLDHVRNLSWQRFEMVVGEAFRRLGYTVAQTGGGVGDDAIDLVLRKDGKQYFVQCKHWKALSVGVRPIRELAGVISARRAAGGIVVSSGSYSKDAVQFARASGIELIDGPALEQMVIDAQEPEPYLESTGRWRTHTQMFDISPEPTCPTCSALMVKRIGKRGAHAGKQFWGCSKYPQCKGTREV
jgi:restriction system protein